MRARSSIRHSGFGIDSSFGFRRSTFRPVVCAAFIFVLILLAAHPAAAHWQSLDFDLTKKDAAAYTTDLPDSAFTPQGLHLKLKGGETYTLTSKATFTGDFSYDLQVDIPERMGDGKLDIDLVLVNSEKKRKVVGTFENWTAKTGTDKGTIQYFKDGKPAGFQWNQNWCEASHTTGHNGTFEWLRLHKAGAKVWFMQKHKQHAYRWPTIADYPKTNYFKEDCESFQIAFVVRAAKDCTVTLDLKTMRISGLQVLPRDPNKRMFLLDFGPVNQELEDDFMPVSEYTNYTPEGGYGWIIPEKEKLIYDHEGVPGLTDKQIEEAGFAAIPKDVAGWYDDFIRRCYWLQLHDKKVITSTSHGGDFIEFFKQWLDLKSPLERDCISMGRPYQFAFNELYQKDIEERRGSLYMDDDLSTEFVVDVPNGHYNVILGVGYSGSWYGGGEVVKYNLDINGRMRKAGLGGNWRRCCQFPIRDVNVEDGKMRFRFYCDVRHAMDPYANHTLAVGWLINYMAILPAEDRELLNEWEWKIIKRRGEIVRRVTFVEGDPAVTHLESSKPKAASAPASAPAPTPAQVAADTLTPASGFLSLNGKPFYFLKLMNNYHPGDTEHSAYYSACNVISAFHNTKGSQHFFKPDWEKMSFSDDYPWDTIDRMNVAFSWGYLTSMHEDTILSFVPHAVSGEGNPTVDSRGRSNRYNVQPPLNSALGKEIQKEAYTMMANQLREHPANAGHFIYEELWHPNEAGYDEQSMIQYWGYLRQKYQTIEALNAAWGRTYKAFDDIQPPKQEGKEFWEYSPEWVEFRIFRGWAQREMVKSACDLVRTLEPDHMSWGAKGDYGTQSFYTGDFLDGFGWYSPYVAASVARYFGKAAISGGYLLHCEDAYLDGRKQFDHKPGPRQYLGKNDAWFYNKLVSGVFKGSKGFFNEWYSDGIQHLFHRTDMIKRDGPAFKVKHWTGQIAFFDDQGYQGPPVQMNRNGLAVQAANQMLYRLGHLWLPASPLKPKVLFPITESGCFLQLFGERPYADFEEVSMRVLQSSNLAADFLNIPQVKDLSPYKLIVMADMANTISKADAQRIRDWVGKGGKLILVNASGFTDDLSPKRFKRSSEDLYPLEAFAELGGYRIEARDAYHMTMGKVNVTWAKTDLAPDIADGQALGSWEVDFDYQLREGSNSTVFLKGVLEKSGKEVVMGLVNKDRSVAVIHMPPKAAAADVVRPISRFVRRLVDMWKVDPRVELGGVDDAFDLYAGCLDGPSGEPWYRLAAACNFSADKPRDFALKITDLPPGDYAVMDVTGQRPDLGVKADGGPTLAPIAAAQRASKIDAVMTAEQIATKGLPCTVKPRQAQVWLIRPMSQKAWVSIWPGALGEFCRRGVTVAYGSGPSDKAGAEKVAAAVTAKGFAASVVPVAEVKRMKLHHEVRINPLKIDRGYHEDMSKWYLLDTFDNEVVDTDKSLVVVGSEETNPLVKHLGADKTFAYDKMGEKPSATYPGAGHGVVGWVDAVNSAIYDLRSQCRDAVVAGGSDAAGTTAACEALATLIDKHAVARPRATYPAVGTSRSKASTQPATRPTRAP